MQPKKHLKWTSQFIVFWSALFLIFAAGASGLIWIAVQFGLPNPNHVDACITYVALVSFLLTPSLMMALNMRTAEPEKVDEPGFNSTYAYSAGSAFRPF